MFQAWLVFFFCFRFYVGVLPSFGCMILDGPYRGPPNRCLGQVASTIFGV